MTLVERFVDIHDWSTSRKTALLSGLACVFFIAGSLLWDVTFWLGGPAVTTIVDRHAIDTVGWLWTAFLASCAATSWIVSRTAGDGRWTFYLLVIPFGALTAFAIYGFGMTSTSVFAAYPLVILLLALWYGLRSAWIGFWYGLTLSAVILYWFARGDSPFAPVFLDRDFDAQRNKYLVSAMYIDVLMVFVFCFILVILTLSARERMQANLDRANGLIRRYVPEQVADAVLSATPEAIDRHERRKLTIFFSDLVGFTDLSDELEPEDLATVLHDYFTEMSAIARRHRGTVDDLVGDAILVLFGAPEATNDHDQALRAVHMATEMQKAMGPLNQRWESAGIPAALMVRMGVNTGVVTVGNFGSADRTKYTALGKQVNVAARIQSECDPGKVLIAHATWLLVRDEIACTPKGELMLKGLHKPMPAYEVRT